MQLRLLSSSAELEQYQQWLESNPHNNLWQSLQWKGYQEALGRKVYIYADIQNETIQASSMVTVDTTTGGYSTWNCSRGPIFKHDVNIEYTSLYLNSIKKIADKNKAIAYYVSPLSSLVYGATWKPSPRHEQPEASRILDLTLSKEELLKQMKPKGRYNIKVANKHNVAVEQVDSTEQYYKLVQLTAKRQGITPLPAKYYGLFLQHLPNAYCLLSFKEKFGGNVEVYQPEHQSITKPLLYNLLKLKRKIF